MRHQSLAVLALAGSLWTSPALAQSGSPALTPTGLTRIVLIRIKPGKAPDFWNDMRQHLKPIYDEEVKRGILTSWGLETKVTSDSENDWSVVLGLTYKNYAALDNLGALTDPITLAHYGSMEKRTAQTMLRGDYATIVQSFLLRNQTVNEWKP